MIDEDAHQTSHVDGSYRRLALKRARLTVHIVLLTVAVAVGWSAFAQIDQITRGDGRVIPLRRMQSIESLEGGILSDLLVSEGDLVKEGQIIANLDATRSRAAFLSAQSEVESLKAEVERLEAEVLEKPALDFGGNPTATEQTELRLFNARRTRLEASLKALEGERSSVQQQLDITGPLASSGSVSRIDVLQLQQKLAELEGKISEARNGYVQDAYRDLAERRAKLSSLQQELVQKEAELGRTVVRSPVEGRINDILITTLGGVVQPGEAIMEITPIDDELLIETRVLPRDVAFIAPEMPASVKITAYDFSVYGDLRGKVTQISEDTVEEDTPNGPQDYYRVMVRTERSYLERFGDRFPIRPGMVAQVDIESGKQSILSYLSRPLLRARLR
ncbi:HlyD family efflux transporter periplasmic adaptor subunit [Paracoccus sp. R12_1]|uniref:HlyD family efflux transporter periplasmic adaptor subunit n=1 Tax=unclassified Paracoccus (in: a-proteobacteria) TaxID=2688777 RepID=UPI001ADA1C15|nr:MULTISPECIES: HlyD family efflux transporter periplasmic adaptor subunit [unclassified Paracoccus (in: a-proteobacteria)]MBO9456408.1 HlyD family efflux transporter periplasmic adaptor subunit [Paracoccus sp. R12_2]MBO9487617.1 HlyD family efflux transporter periplasmic adaptor subunit [Paracoccus sp. R12_1]